MLNYYTPNYGYSEIVFSIRHDGEDCGSLIDMYHTYGHQRHNIGTAQSRQLHEQSLKFHTMSRMEQYTYD